MPRTAKTLDFLDLHSNIHRRVRNLETGVHPTALETGYADTVPPQPIAYTGAWEPLGALAAQQVYPYWQRRFGVVTLLGGFEPAGLDWTGIAAEEPFATLPAGARPVSDLLLLLPATAGPYFVQLRAGADGHMVVLKPAADAGQVRLEGANWTID